MITEAGQEETVEICLGCGAESDELENWGIIDYCPVCVRWVTKYFPWNIDKDISDIKLLTPDEYDKTLPKVYYEMTRAGYYIMSGMTVIHDFDEKNIFEIINHEFMHFVFHKLFGLRCSYQYDNVDETVDPYHSPEEGEQ